MSKTALFSLLLSVMPISELRGAIPFAYLNGISIVQAFALGTAGNLLVIPFGLVFFSFAEKILKRIKPFYNFLTRKIRRVSTNFSKFGYLGLTLFVAVPLPITGAWTAMFGVWLLKLDTKKSSLAIGLGVLIAGIVVSVVMLTGSSLASLFTKTVNL